MKSVRHGKARPTRIAARVCIATPVPRRIIRCLAHGWERERLAIGKSLAGFAQERWSKLRLFWYWDESRKLKTFVVPDGRRQPNFKIVSKPGQTVTKATMHELEIQQTNA